MLSNIKDYQSETASQHSPSQNSPSCCTHVVYLEKNYLWFWIVDAMFVYIHLKKLYWADGFESPLKWIKKEAVSWV